VRFKIIGVVFYVIVFVAMFAFMGSDLMNGF